MGIGIGLLVLGIVVYVATQETSRRRIEAEFGVLDATTAKMSEGTGVVPGWVSGLNLLSLIAMLGGVIWIVVAVVS